MVWYNTALKAMGDGLLDLGAGTFKLAYCSSGYTVDTGDSGDEFYDDGPEAASLVDSTMTLTWTGRIIDLADTSIIDPGSGTATQIVLYKDTGTPATSHLIGYSNTATGLPIAFDGINDSITFNASFTLKLGA